MLDSYQKSTGTQNTFTYALLFAALIAIPAFVVFSRPSGYVPLTLMIVASFSCLMLARLSRRRHSMLTMPSLAQSLTSISTRRQQ